MDMSKILGWIAIVIQILNAVVFFLAGAADLGINPNISVTISALAGALSAFTKAIQGRTEWTAAERKEFREEAKEEK